MDSSKRRLWSKLDLSRQESDMATAHQKVSSHARRLLNPKLRSSLARLKGEIRTEVERLGGNWKLHEKSILNMLKNLEEAAVSAVIPEEVIDAKFPPGP